MPEPLKNHLGPAIPQQIADMIIRVYAEFDGKGFVQDVLQDYETLELLARGWKMAHSLRRFLPQDYGQAAQILMDSLGPCLDSTESFGMAPFVYLPHVFFVAHYGLDDFDVSMRAQYELTQRFSAEFSIRAYLEKYPEATLQRLKIWAHDASPHVRRLVSEGTRPRLPWAARLRAFQRDPAPVLALLELLKDDPVLYVRRSVANNLNDIGKDHPDILYDTAQRWLTDASPERRWILKHALRSAIKRGEAGALAALGYAAQAHCTVQQCEIFPATVSLGGAVTISCELHSTQAQEVLVDLRVWLVKANGKTSPKVFKLKTAKLTAGQVLILSKTISFATMTTRKHYAGVHQVELLVNGVALALGAFEVV